MKTLTVTQVLKLSSIEWLLDTINKDNFATGRSTLMAIAFINIAKKNPGRWVRVWDHFKHIQNDMQMLERIISILQEEKLNYTAKQSTLEFKIEVQ